MKAPVKPNKPQKPYPPDKEQKVNKHIIDVGKLFLNFKYSDGDEEISEEKYYDLCDKDEDHDLDMENMDLTPSIKELLSLIPPGINTDDIYLKLNLGYDTGRRYPQYPYEGFELIYTTPFDYKKELEIYHSKLLGYEDDLVDYNEKMIKYKKELDAYKEFKEKVRLEKKRTLLKKQLADLR